jgi:hypothetical protein
LVLSGCNTTSMDVRKKQEQSGQRSTSSAGQTGGGGGDGQQQGPSEVAEPPAGDPGGEDQSIMGQGPPQGAGGESSASAAAADQEGEGSGAGPRHIGSAGSGAGHVTPDAEDIADQQDDDIVARQLREQAEQEQDPVLRERLWNEYQRYKTGA